MKQLNFQKFLLAIGSGLVLFSGIEWLDINLKRGFFFAITGTLLFWLSLATSKFINSGKFMMICKTVFFFIVILWASLIKFESGKIWMPLLMFIIALLIAVNGLYLGGQSRKK
jgi:hypothetical protein